MPYKDIQKKREASRKYREANLEKERARKRSYMKTDYPPEKAAEASRRWRENHPDKVEKNRPSDSMRTLAWQRENPGRANAKARRYQLLKKRACPVWAEGVQIEGAYIEAARLTRETGIPHEVDHIVPLSGGGICGLHVPWNLRAIPAAVNRRKSNKVIEI
jgi:5-methylcytosine-specific restriction endonuclease McrA